MPYITCLDFKFSKFGILFVVIAEPKYPSLSKDDRAKIIKNLEESIAALNKNERLASAGELHIKSLLTAICWEIKNKD